VEQRSRNRTVPIVAQPGVEVKRCAQWFFDKPGNLSVLANIPVPEPGAGRLLKVPCLRRLPTDLHVVDGELTPTETSADQSDTKLWAAWSGGEHVTGLSVGDRVGVPWLGWTCGQCFLLQGGQ